MSREQTALNWIKDRFSEGRTVMVQTHLRVTKWTPKTARRFEAAGVDPFALATDGGLLMANGRSYVRVLLDCTRISAA